MANPVHWDPFGDRQMGGLIHNVDDWMNRFLRTRRMPEVTNLDISIDVTESDQAYTVKAEMPGVKKEDITINIDGNFVSISAEVKRQAEERKDEKVLREERYYGAVSRAFTLPAEVDQAQAKAQYVNGVLELTLPKRVGVQARRLVVQ